MTDTKSMRPRRRFWGWGLESDELQPMEVAIVKGLMARVGLAAGELPTPPQAIGLFAARPAHRAAGEPRRCILQHRARPPDAQLRQVVRRCGAHVETRAAVSAGLGGLSG